MHKPKITLETTHKHAHCTNNDANWSKFRRARNKIVQMIRESKLIICASKTDALEWRVIKGTWSYSIGAIHHVISWIIKIFVFLCWFILWNNCFIKPSFRNTVSNGMDPDNARYCISLIWANTALKVYHQESVSRQIVEAAESKRNITIWCLFSFKHLHTRKLRCGKHFGRLDNHNSWQDKMAFKKIKLTLNLRMDFRICNRNSFLTLISDLL